MAQVRASRPVAAESWVTEDDIGDIRSVNFGVELPPDAGILVVMSAKWRKGLILDFGPLIALTISPSCSADISLI